MRISGVLLPLSALLLLSACGNVDNNPAHHGDFNNWMYSRPSNIEKTLGTLPYGYRGARPDNLPAPLEQGRYTEVKSEGGSVSVFVETPGTTTTTTTTTETLPAPVSDVTPAAPTALIPAGAPEAELFFPYGGSAISPAAKKELRALASSIKNAGTPVSITVVGHASSRVDGVTDPERKKEINFEIAQKRAEAVTKVLDSAGVNAAWVQTVSKGDEEPNPNPGKRAQEPADRRVDVYGGDSK